MLKYTYRNLFFSITTPPRHASILHAFPDHLKFMQPICRVPTPLGCHECRADPPCARSAWTPSDILANFGQPSRSVLWADYPSPPFYCDMISSGNVQRPMMVPSPRPTTFSHGGDNRSKRQPARQLKHARSVPGGREVVSTTDPTEFMLGFAMICTVVLQAFLSTSPRLLLDEIHLHHSLLLFMFSPCPH